MPAFLMAAILFAVAITAATSVAANVYFQSTFSWFGGPVSEATGNAQDIVNSINAVRTWRWVAFGLFLAWLWAFYSVLWPETEDLSYTPGAAACAFLIPFLNLWKPLGVMSQLWRASERRQLAPVPWKAMPAPLLVRLFFAGWIGTVLFGLVRWWSKLNMRGAQSGDLFGAMGRSGTYMSSLLFEDTAITLAAATAAIIVVKVTRLFEAPVRAT